MSKLAETFRKALSGDLAPRGAVADFIRAAKVSRQTVDRWLTGETHPDLEEVDRAARALKRDPLSMLSAPARTLSERIPEDILQMLADTPQAYEAVRSLLLGFAIQRESEISKSLKKPPKGNKGS